MRQNAALCGNGLRHKYETPHFVHDSSSNLFTLEKEQIDKYCLAWFISNALDGKSLQKYKTFYKFKVKLSYAHIEQLHSHKKNNILSCYCLSKQRGSYDLYSNEIKKHFLVDKAFQFLSSYHCLLNLEQTLDFTCLQHKSCGETVGKGEIVRKKQFFSFSLNVSTIVFSTLLEKFPPYCYGIKKLSFIWEESKMCRLGKY